MPIKPINIKANFQLDTTAARQQLIGLQQQLSGLTAKNTTNLGIGTEITKAIKDAELLKQTLREATNVSTGTFDLTKFTQQIQQAGKTIAEFKSSLSALGPEGEKSFNQLATTIATAQVPLQRTSVGIQKLVTAFGNTMYWQATSMAMHKVVGTMQEAMKYAQNLDKSLNSIQIVTGHSAEYMKNFGKQANEAAKALSASTLEYTNAALIYYQQGLSDKEVQKRTETTLKLAKVTGESASKVSQQMTSVWNNFSNGVDNLERYADVMAALGATTASSSSEIAKGLEKFSSVTKTIGLSYDYAASALATVVAQTRQSADSVGTGFKTLFSRLESLNLGDTLDDGVTLNKYSQALAKVGVNVLDTTGKLKDMDSILDDLGGKWNNLTNAQQVALAQTVGGVRNYTQLITLMDNWQDFQHNVTTAQLAEGTLQKQADIYASSWEAAQQRVTTAAQGIYNTLISSDFFKGFNNSLAAILNIINKTGNTLGTGGSLAGIGSLITLFAGDKLANGIDNLVNNMFSQTAMGKRYYNNIQLDLNKQFQKQLLDTGDLGAGERSSILRQLMREQKEYSSQDYRTKAQNQTAQNLLMARSQQGTILMNQIVDSQTGILNSQITNQHFIEKIAGETAATIKGSINTEQVQRALGMALGTSVRESLGASGYDAGFKEYIQSTFQEQIIKLSMMEPGSAKEMLKETLQNTARNIIGGSYNGKVIPTNDLLNNLFSANGLSQTIKDIASGKFSKASLNEYLNSFSNFNAGYTAAYEGGIKAATDQLAQQRNLDLTSDEGKKQYQQLEKEVRSVANTYITAQAQHLQTSGDTANFKAKNINYLFNNPDDVNNPVTLGQAVVSVGQAANAFAMASNSVKNFSQSVQNGTASFTGLVSAVGSTFFAFNSIGTALSSHNILGLGGLTTTGLTLGGAALTALAYFGINKYQEYKANTLETKSVAAQESQITLNSLNKEYQQKDEALIEVISQYQKNQTKLLGMQVGSAEYRSQLLSNNEYVRDLIETYGLQVGRDYTIEKGQFYISSDQLKNIQKMSEEKAQTSAQLAAIGSDVVTQLAQQQLGEITDTLYSKTQIGNTKFNISKFFESRAENYAKIEKPEDLEFIKAMRQAGATANEEMLTEENIRRFYSLTGPAFSGDQRIYSEKAAAAPNLYKAVIGLTTWIDDLWHSDSQIPYQEISKMSEDEYVAGIQRYQTTLTAQEQQTDLDEISYQNTLQSLLGDNGLTNEEILIASLLGNNTTKAKEYQEQVNQLYGSGTLVRDKKGNLLDLSDLRRNYMLHPEIFTESLDLTLDQQQLAAYMDAWQARAILYKQIDEVMQDFSPEERQLLNDFNNYSTKSFQEITTLTDTQKYGSKFKDLQLTVLNDYSKSFDNLSRILSNNSTFSQMSLQDLISLTQKELDLSSNQLNLLGTYVANYGSVFGEQTGKYVFDAITGYDNQNKVWNQSFIDTLQKIELDNSIIGLANLQQQEKLLGAGNEQTGQYLKELQQAILSDINDHGGLARELFESTEFKDVFSTLSAELSTSGRITAEQVAKLASKNEILNSYLSLTGNNYGAFADIFESIAEGRLSTAQITDNYVTATESATEGEDVVQRALEIVSRQELGTSFAKSSDYFRNGGIAFYQAMQSDYIRDVPFMNFMQDILPAPLFSRYQALTMRSDLKGKTTEDYLKVFENDEKLGPVFTALETWQGTNKYKGKGGGGFEDFLILLDAIDNGVLEKYGIDIDDVGNLGFGSNFTETVNNLIKTDSGKGYFEEYGYNFESMEKFFKDYIFPEIGYDENASTDFASFVTALMSVTEYGGMLSLGSLDKGVQQLTQGYTESGFLDPAQVKAWYAQNASLMNLLELITTEDGTIDLNYNPDTENPLTEDQFIDYVLSQVQDAIVISLSGLADATYEGVAKQFAENSYETIQYGAGEAKKTYEQIFNKISKRYIEAVDTNENGQIENNEFKPDKGVIYDLNDVTEFFNNQGIAGDKLSEIMSQLMVEGTRFGIKVGSSLLGNERTIFSDDGFSDFSEYYKAVSDAQAQNDTISEFVMSKIMEEAWNAVYDDNGNVKDATKNGATAFQEEIDRRLAAFKGSRETVTMKELDETGFSFNEDNGMVVSPEYYTEQNDQLQTLKASLEGIQNAKQFFLSNLPLNPEELKIIGQIFGTKFKDISALQNIKPEDLQLLMSTVSTNGSLVVPPELAQFMNLPNYEDFSYSDLIDFRTQLKDQIASLPDSELMQSIKYNRDLLTSIPEGMTFDNIIAAANAIRQLDSDRQAAIGQPIIEFGLNEEQQDWYSRVRTTFPESANNSAYARVGELIYGKNGLGENIFQSLLSNSDVFTNFRYITDYIDIIKGQYEGITPENMPVKNFLESNGILKTSPGASGFSTQQFSSLLDFFVNIHPEMVDAISEISQLYLNGDIELPNNLNFNSFKSAYDLMSYIPQLNEVFGQDFSGKSREEILDAIVDIGKTNIDTHLQDLQDIIDNNNFGLDNESILQLSDFIQTYQASFEQFGIGKDNNIGLAFNNILTNYERYTTQLQELEATITPENFAQYDSLIPIIQDFLGTAYDITNMPISDVKTLISEQLTALEGTQTKIDAVRDQLLDEGIIIGEEQIGNIINFMTDYGDIMGKITSGSLELSGEQVANFLDTWDKLSIEEQKLVTEIQQQSTLLNSLGIIDSSGSTDITDLTGTNQTGKAKSSFSDRAMANELHMAGKNTEAAAALGLTGTNASTMAWMMSGQNSGKSVEQIIDQLERVRSEWRSPEQEALLKTLKSMTGPVEEIANSTALTAENWTQWTEGREQNEDGSYNGDDGNKYRKNDETGEIEIQKEDGTWSKYDPEAQGPGNQEKSAVDKIKESDAFKGGAKSGTYTDENGVSSNWTVDEDGNIVFEASGQNNARILEYASGLGTPHVAVTGELGPELHIKENGDMELLGQKGREYAFVNPNDRIYTADQTRKILSNMHTSDLDMLATGINNILPGYIEGLDGPDNGNTQKGGSKGGSGSKSDGSSGKKNDKDPRYDDSLKIRDILERYYTILQQLDNIIKKIERIGQAVERAWGEERIRNIQKQTELYQKQYEAQKKYIDEIQGYLTTDRKAMDTSIQEFIDEWNEKAEKNTKLEAIRIPGGAQYDENGVLINYREIVEKMVETFNSAKENHGLKPEDQKKLEERLKDIQFYTDTLNLYEEQTAALEDMKNQILDSTVKEITYRVEYEIELNNDVLNLLNFDYGLVRDNMYRVAESIELIGEQADQSVKKIQTFQDGIMGLLNIYSPDALQRHATSDLGIEIGQNGDIIGGNDSEAYLMKWIRKLKDLNSDKAKIADEIEKAIERDENGKITNQEDILKQLIIGGSDIIGSLNNDKTMDEQIEKWMEELEKVNKRAAAKIKQQIKRAALKDDDDIEFTNSDIIQALVEGFTDIEDAPDILGQIDEWVKASTQSTNYNDTINSWIEDLAKFDSDAAERIRAKIQTNENGDITNYQDIVDELNQAAQDLSQEAKELLMTDPEAFYAKMSEYIANTDKNDIDASIIEQLSNYTQQILTESNNLLSLYSNQIDAISNQIKLFNKDLENEISKLDHYEGLYQDFVDIVNLTNKEITGVNAEFFKAMNNASIDNAINKVKATNRAYKLAAMELQGLQEQYRQMQQQYEQEVSAGGMDETRKRIWETQLENMRQAVIQANGIFQDAENSFLTSWKDALSKASEVYKDTIEQAGKDFEKSFSPLFSTLELLSAQFDREKELGDLYVKDYQRIHDLSKLNRDIEQSIIDTDNLKGKNRLRDLQKEINDLQESGVELSEYDLDILDKKYKLELARQALEDARDAKSVVRLSRDNNGNWSYVYSADEDEVAEAEQAYEDAIRDMEQANEDYINNLEEQILSVQQKAQQAISQLDPTEMGEDEYFRAVQDILEKANQNIEFLAQQMGNAIDNNNYLLDPENIAERYGVAGHNLTDEFGDTILAKLLDEDDLGNLTDAAAQRLKDFSEAVTNAFVEYSDKQKEVYDAAEHTMEGITDEFTDMSTDISQLSTDTADTVVDMSIKMENAYVESLAAMEAASHKFTDQTSEMIAVLRKLVEQLTEVKHLSGESVFAHQLDFGSKLDNLQEFNDIKAALQEYGIVDVIDENGEAHHLEAGTEQTKEFMEQILRNIAQNEAIDVGDAVDTKDEYDNIKEVYDALLDGESMWVKIGEELIELIKGTEEAEALLEEWQENIKSSANGVDGPYCSTYGLGVNKCPYGGCNPYTHSGVLDTGGYTGRWQSADTGMYTGEWANGSVRANGRLAWLHQKELVLNAHDTENFLDAMKIVRQLDNLANWMANGLGDVVSPRIETPSETLQQEVTIHAEFPNAVDHNEIEMAFDNLVNLASQYANRK